MTKRYGTVGLTLFTLLLSFHAHANDTDPNDRIKTLQSKVQKWEKSIGFRTSTGPLSRDAQYTASPLSPAEAIAILSEEASGSLVVSDLVEFTQNIRLELTQIVQLAKVAHGTQTTPLSVIENFRWIQKNISDWEKFIGFRPNSTTPPAHDDQYHAVSMSDSEAIAILEEAAMGKLILTDLKILSASKRLELPHLARLAIIAHATNTPPHTILERFQWTQENLKNWDKYVIGRGPVSKPLTDSETLSVIEGESRGKFKIERLMTLSESNELELSLLMELAESEKQSIKNEVISHIDHIQKQIELRIRAKTESESRREKPKEMRRIR